MQFLQPMNREQAAVPLAFGVNKLQERRFCVAIESTEAEGKDESASALPVTEGFNLAEGFRGLFRGVLCFLFQFFRF